MAGSGTCAGSVNKRVKKRAHYIGVPKNSENSRTNTHGPTLSLGPVCWNIRQVRYFICIFEKKKNYLVYYLLNQQHPTPYILRLCRPTTVVKVECKYWDKTCHKKMKIKKKINEKWKKDNVPGNLHGVLSHINRWFTGTIMRHLSRNVSRRQLRRIQFTRDVTKCLNVHS